MGLKFLNFFECKAEDVDKVIAKSKKWEEDRAKNPEKFSKILFPAHIIAGDLPTLTKDMRWIGISEADDPQVLIKAIATWLPEVTLKQVRIEEGTKFMEAYEKLKQ